MFTSWMHRPVVSDRTVLQACGVACGLAGALVLILGFRRLEHLELTETQLLSAVLQTLLLSVAFVSLGLLVSRREPKS